MFSSKSRLVNASWRTSVALLMKRSFSKKITTRQHPGSVWPQDFRTVHVSFSEPPGQVCHSCQYAQITSVAFRETTHYSAMSCRAHTRVVANVTSQALLSYTNWLLWLYQACVARATIEKSRRI